MSDLERGHGDARNNWRSPFQFEPSNGGLGIQFTASGDSQRAALVGEGFTIMVTVEGENAVHLALGDDTIEAISAYMLCIPGSQCFTLKPEDRVTHAAVITRTGTAFIQITRGNGG